jgi:leucyl-tRNA synthetase
MKPENKEKKLAWARQMRQNPTAAERHMWEILGAKKTGYKWRRQHLMLGYIADFYCPSFQLIIELDGSSHRGREAWDAKRDKAFKSYGFAVVHMTNERALSFTLESMKQWLNGPPLLRY